MATTSVLLVAVVSLIIWSTCAHERAHLSAQPEQIHLSLGENPRQMVVTWTTFSPTPNSTVFYGADALDKVAYGSQTKFIDGGSEKRQLFIHRVTLDNLKPRTRYRYYVGSNDGWSSLYTFRTLPDTSDWSPSIAVFGDLGSQNAQTLGQLQKEVQEDRYDLVLHVGDFAYDMDSDNARVGDAFMRQIEPIAAYVPYQVCPGNHEEAYNFSNYDNRFTMRSSGSEVVNNFFWSQNIGRVHLISFTTEFHFFTKYGTQQIMNQYRWLEADLKEANKPENRARQPWIITMGHRPMYGELESVNRADEIIRKGTKEYPGFESLFYKYGVDIEFYGHIHNYERIYPIYDSKVYNGTDDPANPYKNPKAPVHITTGSAGCPENLTPKLKKRPSYSALVVSDYGFTRMNVLNATHVHIQQTAESKNWAVVDDVYVIKDKHGVEAWK